MKNELSGQNNNQILSIIIPHFNGEKIIIDCLKSIHKISFKNKEIIIVDNGSTDKSISLIEIQFPEIKIIKSKINLGYAGGCNLGAKHAIGKYLIFLNNDTLHESNWIEPLIKKLESDNSISSVQPKILNASNKKKFDYAGGSGGFLDKYGFPLARGRIFDTIEIDNGQYNNSCEIFWASGTAFITKKTIFHKMNGFDETLFAHFEEIDYHWKCKLAGYKIWVQPKSIVYHIGGATLSYESPQKAYLNHRNNLVLILTNTSKSELFKYLFPRIFFEKISILKYLITGNFSYAFAQIRAIFWIFLNFKFIINKRKFIKKLNPKYNSKYFYNKSIVLDYFLFCKRKFSDLNLS